MWNNYVKGGMEGRESEHVWLMSKRMENNGRGKIMTTKDKRNKQRLNIKNNIDTSTWNFYTTTAHLLNKTVEQIQKQMQHK